MNIVSKDTIVKYISNTKLMPSAVSAMIILYHLDTTPQLI